MVMKTVKQEISSEKSLKNIIMGAMDRPEITSLARGDLIKTLQIKGHAGTVVPPYYITKKALLVVDEGRALLHMLESDHILKTGSVFIVPAGKELLIRIQKDFKAVLVTDVNSKINFT